MACTSLHDRVIGSSVHREEVGCISDGKMVSDQYMSLLALLEVTEAIPSHSDMS